VGVVGIGPAAADDDDHDIGHLVSHLDQTTTEENMADLLR
jgi:hypothetical protein